MSSTYFAYGSNLSRARMLARVPSARAEGAAWLAGFRLSLDKRSRDGSGKANLRPSPAGRVHGVLYTIEAAHWPDLDACEPGYRREAIGVVSLGRELEAWTYLSDDLTPDAVAYDWYKQLIVQGASEHALPADWQRHLATLPSRPDPRGEP